MATASSRATFKEYCLRALGKPVIEINVDEDQVDDRVDEALEYWIDYHYDGTEYTFLKHQVTADDKTNKYITISENIIGIVDLFDIGDALSTNNLFNIRYQIALNDLYDLSRYDLVPYFMNFQNIRFIEEMLVGKQMFRFNRHTDKLHIDMDWEKINVDQYIVAKVYQKIDPDTNTDAWNDRWLKRYATALIKKQWGANLIKYEGMQLPGGVQFNGRGIYEDAINEIQKLEEEMITSYSLPVHDMIG
jgi:hypothetical protein